MPPDHLKDQACCFLKLDIVTVFTTIFMQVLYIWCFHLILFFINSFIQGRLLSSNGTSLLGTKLEKIL